MYTLKIENVPSDLYEQLNQSAAEHGRSLNDEAIVWLKHALHLKRVDPEKFIARIESLNKEVSLPSLTDDFLKQAKELGRQ